MQEQVLICQKFGQNLKKIGRRTFTDCPNFTDSLHG